MFSATCFIRFWWRGRELHPDLMVMGHLSCCYSTPTWRTQRGLNSYFLIDNQACRPPHYASLVGQEGIEPSTFRISVGCSTFELLSNMFWSGHMESNHDLGLRSPLFCPLNYIPINNSETATSMEREKRFSVKSATVQLYSHVLLFV